MKFGEKVRQLRTEQKMTQAQLAEKAGISLRTVVSYEKGSCYPKNREMYRTLAAILGVNETYLRNEDEEFVAEAAARGGTRGKRQAEELVSEVGALFAGGELTERDKDAVMKALQQAYWDAKADNVRYAPKKFRLNEKANAEEQEKA